MQRNSIVGRVLVSLCGMLIGAGCGGGGGGASESSGTTTATEVPVVSFATNDFQTGALDDSTVDSAGGTFSVTAGALDGLSIYVPVGATEETITFAVSYADVSSATNLPDGAVVASKAIRISADGSDDWDTFKMFDGATLVTLPYDEPADPTTEDDIQFYVAEEDGTLTATGFYGQDTTNNTISFFVTNYGNAGESDSLTGSLSAKRGKGVGLSSALYNTYVAIGTASLWDAWLANGTTIDTGFRAASDGWYIPNFGSYLKPSRNGNCMGMVAFAKWHYAKYGAGLYNRYRDAGNTTTWLDDAVAIQLASRAHGAMDDRWDDIENFELTNVNPTYDVASAAAVAKSYVGALYVTGKPVLLSIAEKHVLGDGTLQKKGYHAISAYAVTITADGTVAFRVYDPNFRNDDTRTVTFTNGTGFSLYQSGATAGSSRYSYNYFEHFGFSVFASDALFTNLKEAADANFSGDSIFPTVTVTTIQGKTNGENVLDGASSHSGTTDEGESKYITTDTSIVLGGTILGGKAQVAGSLVQNARIFVGGERFSTPVNNLEGSGDGAFSVTLPLKQGENEIVILGAKQNSWSWWSGFKRLIVESTASPSDMQITMEWNLGSSDVDMYVKEPITKDDLTASGDTVYWQHRKGTSASAPYLDFDNTSGYGPEHYITPTGTSTCVDSSCSSVNPDGLYGTYRVKVHYYDDAEDDLTAEAPVPTRPVTYTVSWRYLAYCAAPCADPEADGTWFSGSRTGVLSTASSSNCCNVANTGGDWSSAIEINYPQPDPDDFLVQDPPAVMLP